MADKVPKIIHPVLSHEVKLGSTKFGRMSQIST